MTARRDSEQAGLLASGAVMAAGTAVSRLSGFLRSGLLAAALGLQLHGDLFNIANTIPNMLYILLAGGVFNAVLVPQLVRAMREDPDGGEAYTNRVVTLAALFLGGVTVLLVLAAPWVMSVFLDSSFDRACLAPQRESVIDFARYCLPQVFFYGMYVLIGQILNARGRFGPMMWAPIANNVISVAVLVAYLAAFGPATGRELVGPFTPTQELVLGLGSTLGILAQFLILVPYVRAAGFRLRPRFDFRGSGLGHTLRLGLWTVLFVIVNQVAYSVIVRLASSGTAAVGCGGAQAPDTSGYSVYAFAFLIVMVPHSVVTVSLATAVLPRLSDRAADADLRGLGRTLTATLCSALALVVPFAALLPVISPDLARLFLHAGASDNAALFVRTLALFAPGLALFTVHYMLLRGFYALEENRTVFWNQCWVAGTNIVVAVVLVGATSDAQTAPSLVLAYAAAYLVGAVLSYVVLRRRRVELDGVRLLRFGVRLGVATAVATVVAAAASWILHVVAADPDWPIATVWLAVVGTVDLAVLLVLARLMRLTEVTTVLDTVTRRLPVLGRR